MGTRTGVATRRARVAANDWYEMEGDAITNTSRQQGMMGRFPHLLQYTSESLALWLQMPDDAGLAKASVP